MNYLIDAGIFLAGALIAYLVSRLAALRRQQELSAQLNQTIAEKEAALLKAQSQAAASEDNYQHLLNEKTTLQNKIDKLLADNSEAKQELARRNAEMKSLETRINDKVKEYDELREKFKVEFENIATKILKENSREFATTNHQRIDEIIKPFRERIEKFENTVRQTHESNIKEQNILRTELKNLHDLNMKMSQEANNLTKALKGDVKKQGNWGEVILEKVLERSGLRRGFEYEREVAITTEETRYRPDAVIYLPDNKHIIIDSKVSLVAYNQYVESEDDADKQKALQQHLQSVRGHVKKLAEKEYHITDKLDAPDFVLLFMPLESAFSLAIQHDNELFNFAWDKKIVMVSPTTLLATLQTVASLWKHEKHKQNVILIAKEGEKLYERINQFLTEFEKLEKPLESARKSYQYLRDKFVTSRQSLARTALKLKELGVGTQSSKQIPEQYQHEIDDSQE
jgi:DNA recombination protein RmuC